VIGHRDGSADREEGNVLVVREAGSARPDAKKGRSSLAVSPGNSTVRVPRCRRRRRHRFRLTGGIRRRRYRCIDPDQALLHVDTPFCARSSRRDRCGIPKHVEPRYHRSCSLPGGLTYVRGEAHTNTVEGYFSILKRGIVGTYHHVGQQHLKRYLAEFDFRYNARTALGIGDVERTERALRG